jgi:hypothetical protein
MKLLDDSSPRLSCALLGDCRPVIEADSWRPCPADDPAVKEFVQHFTDFEWRYLCSYQWFLDDLGPTLRGGNHRALQLKAREKLVSEGLRPRALTGNDELSLCHSLVWYD